MLGFTGDDYVDFFPPAPEALQSTQVDHQFYGRGEAVWSLFDGRFKNFFGVNYTNSWSWNLDPNPDSFNAPPAIAPPTTNLGQRTQVDWRGEARVVPGQTLVFGLEDKTESLWTNSTGAFNCVRHLHADDNDGADRRQGRLGRAAVRICGSVLRRVEHSL